MGFVIPYLRYRSLNPSRCLYDAIVCMHPMWSLPVVVVLGLLLAAGCDAQPAISGLSPAAGSLAGGTRLVITGSGFSRDRFTGGNVVYVGSYPCTVLNHKTSDSLITCVTSAAAGPGSYSVTVVVDGAAQATRCCYSYSTDYTPTVHAVWPPAGPAGSAVTLYGYSNWMLDQDCTETQLTDGSPPSCIGSVMFNGYLCTPDAVSYVKGSFTRFSGAWLYRLTCKLPNPKQGDPQIGVGMAGDANASVSFEGRFVGGLALNKRAFMVAAPNRQPRMFQVYAQVNSVSPAAGSLAGGTLVTIRGKGFPNSPALASSAITALRVGGMTCPVVNSTFDTITCMTQAEPVQAPVPVNPWCRWNSSSSINSPGSNSSSDANGTATGEPVCWNGSIKGQYPGMRGILYEYFNRTTAYSGLPLVMDNWTVTAAAGDASAVLGSAWDSPHYDNTSFCTRTSAFFTAPTGGAFTFWVAADDYARLRINFNNGTSAYIVNVHSYTGRADEWQNYAYQKSRPVDLQDKEVVLLEAAHCQGPGPSLLQVGVSMPSSTPAWHSMRSIQRITVQNTLASQTRVLRVLYPPGNDTVLDITVTAAAGSNASMLQHPMLGLNITVNGVGLSELIPVAGGQAAADRLDSLLQGVLKLAALDVGVELLQGSGSATSVTFRVAVPQAKASNLSIAATLDIIRPPPTPPPVCSNATCFFAAPVWVPDISPDNSSSSAGTTMYVPSYPRRPIAPGSDAACSASGNTSATTDGLSLDGLSVAVTTAVVQGVSMAGATIDFWGLDAFSITTRPWDASASDIDAAVRWAIPGYNPSVTRERLRVGARVGVQWTLVFNYWLYTNTPITAINAVISAASPQAAAAAVTVTMQDTQPASTPLNGWFNLAIGDYCDTVQVAIDDAAEVLQAKLAKLPRVSDGVDVERSGSIHEGFVYTVTFSALAGDMPSLRVVDSNVTGSRPSIRTAVVARGSPELFYGPIPAEFLRVPVPANKGIQLEISGVPSACGCTLEGVGQLWAGSTITASSYAACNFEATAAATPTLSSVVPNGTITPVNVLNVVLTGNGLSAVAADNTIMLGATRCQRVLVTKLSPTNSSVATQLACGVPADTVAGKRKVSVNVAGKGFAEGNLTVWLDTLAINSWAPGGRALSAAGTTMLTVNGKGFDPSHCNYNQVWIGGVRCYVLGCTKSTIAVLYPGGQANSTTPVEVWVQGDDGTFDPSTSMKRASWTVNVAEPNTTGWRVAELLSEAALSVEGGSIRFRVEGFSTSSIKSWRVQLLPEFDLTTLNFSDAQALAIVNASMASGIACTSPTAEGSDVASCSLRVVPPGRYMLAVTVLGSTYILLPSGGGAGVLSSAYGLYSVTPSLGSIGGGTQLTLRGRGFAAMQPSMAVVVIKVPVSTTFLNGLILCDVLNVTAGSEDIDGFDVLTCMTRPHLATDASSEDAMARNVEARATEPGLVQLVLCTDSPQTDVLKLYCWDDPTPRTACYNDDPSACMFSYSWSVTPVVIAASPTIGMSGDVLTLQGNAFDDVTAVWLTAPWGSVSCPVVDVYSTNLTCTIPDMPAGQYRVRVQKANGDFGVDIRAFDTVRFTYSPVITRIEQSVGSVQGGRMLRLTSPAAAFNMTHPSRNMVLVAGVPCAVDAGSISATSISCRTPSLAGQLLAEYWQMPSGTSNLPESIGTFTNPDARGLLNTLSLNWGTSVPTGLRSADYWAARFSFVLLAPVTGNYTLSATVDDVAQLDLDGDVLMPRGGSRRTVVWLDRGYHDVVMHYLEAAGSASLRLAWDGGVPNAALVTIPASSIYLVRPGEPVPVQAVINGAPARLVCNSTAPVIPDTATPAAVADPAEPRSLASAVPECAYFASSWLTPMVTSTAVIPGPAGGMAAGSMLQLNGSLLTNSSSDIAIMVGDVPCTVQSVAGDGASVTCLLPDLTAGPADVTLVVAGAGAATMPAGGPALPLTVLLSVGRVIASARASMFGGFELTVNGSGFGVFDASANSSACGTSIRCSNASMSVSVTGSTPGPVEAVLLSSTFSLATIRVPRFVATSAAATFQLNLQLRVFDKATNTTISTATAPFTLDRAFAPSISTVSPRSVDPYTASNITLTWTLPAAAAAAGALLNATQPGAASTVTVALQAGRNTQRFACANAAVVSSNLTVSQYVETVTCTAGADMPAAVYGMWACLPAVGCGYFASAVRINATVTGISAAAGSTAGGTRLVITGTGFGTRAADVQVQFGQSTCRVLDSTPSSITCVTSGLQGNMTAGTPYPLSLAASQGAVLQTLPDVTFTFDASLTPLLVSVSPSRGSTEGGTQLTLSGNFPVSPAGNLSVSLGEVPCEDAQLLNANTITCTTAHPTGGNASLPKPQGPQPVRVVCSDWGNSACNGTARGVNGSAGGCGYQFVDLWSRKTTWGGGEPPAEGDTVMVPGNTTVLLDVSASLYALVLEGNLLFDDTAEEELHLQANYILIQGGSLQIGREDAPFPGAAKITLHGPPDSRELPLYGAKVLAVREGTVRLHGQPKLPTWTLLNSTADQGDTTINVNGPINWVVGDRIAIASSSFYATDVDEATVTNVTCVTAGCEVVQLGLDTVLNYTHLGEVVTVPGDDRGHVLDMRAEVAVLNRNVRFFGDDSSPDTLFGAQIMVSTPGGRARASLQFSHVELQWVGQAFRLGRYPIHWHMHADGRDSWVKGCSIHHSFQRAVTIHGTHNVLLQANVAYDIMGHTYFFEDGVETGSTLVGNLGMLTRVSNAMLNTDTTPATFWITNPNNTIRDNRAAGSAGYGFWYRLLNNPEGPSYTTSSCPKFTPLGRFLNNVAHSNMFYGFRIHPEYYPIQRPCDMMSNFQQVPAVFEGLVSYKNGVKGAIATQVGLVQFRNFTVADNGAGPITHVINGKEHGGGIEIAWVVDDRNRYNVDITNMAGMQNALIVSRTAVGQRGTAGQWPSGRGVRGLLTQSPAPAHPKYSALMSAINVTFVNYSIPNSQFRALEACAKCKDFQGGSTTFTRGLKFIQDGLPALSQFSWASQGYYLDIDSTLLNSDTLPASDLPTNWQLGPGATLHSAVDDRLFDVPECVFINAGNAAYCKSDLTFRRMMLNGHGPDSLKFSDLLVTSETTNRTARLHFTNYNQQGYQFVCATQRAYWLHWDTPVAINPDVYSLHDLDLLNATAGWVHMVTKWPQVQDRVEVNGKVTTPALLGPPPANASHGALFYNKTRAPVGWYWGNETLDVTAATMLLSGPSGGTLRVVPQACPVRGCNVLPPVAADIRNGTLFWSDNATWANTTGGKPVTGSNVTIPFGWQLVIDESPPPLNLLLIEGAVSFSNTSSIILTATYIVVQNTGVLSAGSAGKPHPAAATILLSGTRNTPQLAITSSLVLGSKVLAAVSGGRLALHGLPVIKRWTRLATPVAAGDSIISVVGNTTELDGWALGREVLITSSTFNPEQAETRRIVAVDSTTQPGQPRLTLDSPLSWYHGGAENRYSGSQYMLDNRAEVALLTSNVVIAPQDGDAQYLTGGGKFGPRVVAAGNATAQLSNIRLEYCGHAGLDRACVQFEGLTGQPAYSSYLTNSLVMRGHSAAVRTLASSITPALSTGVLVKGNVLVESYDTSTVSIGGHHGLVNSNLALGTIKDMTGKSNFDVLLPATYEVLNSAVNTSLVNNVAAGSHRLGFHIPGEACSSLPNAAGGLQFLNNVAHSNLVGLVLRGVPDGGSCTALANFTTYLNWDFGIITLKGITSDVTLQHVVVADTRHTGIMIMRKAEMTEPAQVTISGGLLVGRSSQSVCSACMRRPGMTSADADPGCHPRLSRQSFDKASPFGPSVGLATPVFALDFTVGPEMKPYDHVHGYQTVLGNTQVSGLTFVNFEGLAACGGAPDGPVYALSNHLNAPDAAHPLFIKQVTKLAVPDEGMFYMYGPDPAWRNEADCGMAEYQRADGSILPLNCAGPKHAYFRDVDGSLTGSRASTVLGAFFAPRSASNIDQGSGVIPGPCSWSPAFKAYHCKPGATTTQLSSGWLPNPMPAAGIWADPQLLVIESRDSDTEDRNFSPVMLETGGVVDLAITAMDQGWCMQAYTCQKRLSTFWLTAAMGHRMTLNFTGTPSKVLRVWLPYADPAAELVLAINMQQTPNRRFAWSEPRRRIDPMPQPPMIGDSSGHGDYFWDQDTTLFTMKLKGGGSSIEIRTESAIAVTQRLAVTLNEFYDTQSRFLANLAFVLGIDVSRIKVMKIVSGSVILDYLITQDPAIANAPIPETTFNTSNNVDMETAALLASMTPAEQAAYMAAAAAATQQSNSNTAGESDPNAVNLGGTGGTSGNGTSSGGGAAAAAAAAAELLAVFVTLKTSIADGSMERNTGYQTLDFSATVIVTNNVKALGNTTASTTVTLADILQGQPERPAPPTYPPPATPAAPPDSSAGSGDRPILPIVLPVVLGVSVMAAAALLGFKISRMRHAGRVMAAPASGPAPVRGASARNMLVSLSRKLYRITSLDKLEAVGLTSQVTTVDLPGTPSVAGASGADSQQALAASTSTLVAAAVGNTAGRAGSSSPPTKWASLGEESPAAEQTQQQGKGRRQRLPPLTTVSPLKGATLVTEPELLSPGPP